MRPDPPSSGTDRRPANRPGPGVPWRPPRTRGRSGKARKTHPGGLGRRGGNRDGQGALLDRRPGVHQPPQRLPPEDRPGRQDDDDERRGQAFGFRPGKSRSPPAEIAPKSSPIQDDMQDGERHQGDDDQRMHPFPALFIETENGPAAPGGHASFRTEIHDDPGNGGRQERPEESKRGERPAAEAFSGWFRSGCGHDFPPPDCPESSPGVRLSRCRRIK